MINRTLDIKELEVHLKAINEAQSQVEEVHIDNINDWIK